MLSSDVGRKPETSHGVVTYHKVTLKKKKHRRNHSQGESEKKEATQQGYEDSEKNIEDLEQR